MAINVNNVYKTVLSVLNKEQRGYLNPYEYNNIAKQVQLEILEKLFYDYNRFLNIEKTLQKNNIKINSENIHQLWKDAKIKEELNNE